MPLTASEVRNGYTMPRAIAASGVRNVSAPMVCKKMFPYIVLDMPQKCHTCIASPLVAGSKHHASYPGTVRLTDGSFSLGHQALHFEAKGVSNYSYEMLTEKEVIRG